MVNHSRVAWTAFKALIFFAGLSFLANPLLRHTTTSTNFGIRRTMASVKLNDGTTIPILAFGSGTALYGKDATKQVVQAIQAGFRHIDAAQMYRNEESVGEAIVSAGVPRSELYITTKLGKLPAGKTVRDTLVESLRKLKLDYVDLFLIHMPNEHPDLEGI